MKKRIMKLATIVMASSLILALVACGTKPSPEKEKAKPTLATTEVLALSLATTGNMIGSLDMSALAMNERTSAEILIADIDKQIAIMESYISDSPIGYVSEISDRTEYTHKSIISAKDLVGNTLQYTMYYNEVLEGSEAIAQEDIDDDEDEDEDEDDLDQEQEFAITGVLVVDGVDYKLVGQKELEEGEFELELTAYLNESETSYILFEQEIEAGEEEFAYKIYNDNVLIDEFEIEVERDASGEEEFKYVSNKNGQSIEMEYAKEVEDGITKYEIENTINDVKTTVELVIGAVVDGKQDYTYTLADGTEVLIVKTIVTPEVTPDVIPEDIV